MIIRISRCGWRSLSEGNVLSIEEKKVVKYAVQIINVWMLFISKTTETNYTKLSAVQYTLRFKSPYRFSANGIRAKRRCCLTFYLPTRSFSFSRHIRHRLFSLRGAERTNLHCRLKSLLNCTSKCSSSCEDVPKWFLQPAEQSEVAGSQIR